MGFYVPPRIKMVRQDVQTSVVLTGGEVIPALIGTSLGKTSGVTGYQATMGATDTYSLPDLRPAGPIKAISQLRSSLQGGIKYATPADFSFVDGSPQEIVFQDVALAPPYLLSVDEAPAASSSLSNSTTYYYVITAIRDLDLTGPVVGETSASNEVSGRPIAATSHLKLTWRPVAGAKGYKIYRSTTAGNYTGSALLATVGSGFVTTYEDTGSATSAGSPPGVLVFARTVAGTAPTSFAAGSVATIDVDGTPNIVMLAGTRPSLTASGASYPVTITGGNNTLNLKITDSTGAVVSPIIITPGSYTAAAIAAFINPFPFTGGSADGSSGQLVLKADAAGSISKVEVTGGTSLGILGLTVSSATGTGSLPDFEHITTANLVTAFNLQLIGATASIDAATGRLAIARNIGGTAHTLQPHSDANTLLGFSVSLVTGNDATPGTALRRPAFHGDLFFVDYTYVSFGNFVAQRWSNLKKLIAEYGLGSDLAIAGTLAMGTSGSGNGASQVVAMPVPTESLDAYEAALDLLRRRRDVTLVVPLTVLDGINTATKAHVIEASNDENQRERRAVLGTPKNTLVGDEDTAGTVVFYARQLDNDRCILVHPWPFVNVQANDGSIAETELDGWASAAAVAGRIASLSDRATSPTVQQLFGITRLGVDLDEPEMNTCASAGACVLTVEDGNVEIRDGITTSLDDQALQRIQIGLVDDFLRQTFRKQFKNFRGRKLLPTLLKLIVRRTTRILALFQKLELIAGYNASSISAVQDADVLTTVDANFSYRPMFDLKELIFNYFFDLSTGSVA